ncbi:hypothetical protein UlMin_010307 [Ulmus minor]
MCGTARPRVPRRSQGRQGRTGRDLASRGCLGFRFTWPWFRYDLRAFSRLSLPLFIFLLITPIGYFLVIHYLAYDVLQHCYWRLEPLFTFPRIKTFHKVGYDVITFNPWCVAISLSAIYAGLLYVLYVPDWRFGPTCNSTGMIHRYVLGIDHLYQKPVYRNLKMDGLLSNSDLQDCNMTTNGQVPVSSPPWWHAPFDLETIVTCIIGLQYGHILAQLESWSLFSVLIFAIGLLLDVVGVPANKCLYTISYILISFSFAGITFYALYLLVDVYVVRCLTSVIEWIGKHSLSIFIHWIISCFVKK